MISYQNALVPAVECDRTAVPMSTERHRIDFTREIRDHRVSKPRTTHGRNSSSNSSQSARVQPCTVCRNPQQWHDITHLPLTSERQRRCCHQSLCQLRHRWHDPAVTWVPHRTQTAVRPRPPLQLSSACWMMARVWRQPALTSACRAAGTAGVGALRLTRAEAVSEPGAVASSAAELLTEASECSSWFWLSSGHHFAPLYLAASAEPAPSVKQKSCYSLTPLGYSEEAAAHTHRVAGGGGSLMATSVILGRTRHPQTATSLRPVPEATGMDHAAVAAICQHRGRWLRCCQFQ